MNFNEEVVARLETVADLPTLPTVAQAILQGTSSVSSNAADIGRLIERDVALAGKVLKIVNSAYYGFPRQIRSIQHAVVIIGFSKIKNVVLTVSVFDIGRAGPRPPGRLDIRRLWQHSLATGLAAKAAAETVLGNVSADDAFMAGLLHDIGKIVLDLHLPDAYGPAVERAAREETLLIEAEKETFGVNAHARVGHWIAERWRLPTALRDAIASHHAPGGLTTHRVLANAVHLGDILARSLGVGDGGDRRLPAIDAGVVQHHNLTAERLDQAMRRFVEELSRATDFFALLERPWEGEA